MLGRFGRWCALHRWTVIIAWVILLVTLSVSSGVVGSGFSSQFDLPSSESTRGFDIIDQSFGGAGGGQTGSLVFRADQGVEDPAVQSAITGYLDQIATLEDVRVVSPFTEEGSAQIVTAGPEAGKTAYAQIEVPQDIEQTRAVEIGNEIRDSEPEVAGLQVELGGAIFAEFAAPQSELLGLAFAIVILILAFGSVLAMGLPIGTALAGIGFGVAVVTLLSNVFSMPDFATTLGVMIGLGVGIDYALFIVTRYREFLHQGLTVPEAVGRSLDTAGRAVIFAGVTVVISLMGMLVVGVAFISGLGIGAAVTVFCTMLAATSLLPALLGLAGARVEVTRWRGLIAAALVAVALLGLGLHVQPLIIGLPLAVIVLLAGLALAPLKKELPRRPPKPLDQTLAYRWSRVIQRRPWPSFILGVAFLAILAIPVFSLRLGFSDEGNYPADTSTRKAYDLLADGFGPGFNGPLVLAANLPSGTPQASLDKITAALQETPGVDLATPAITNDPANPTAALWRVIPTTSPQDAATTSLVKDLRERVMPETTAGTGVQVEVSGSVAAQVDFSDYLASRIPIFFGVVLALSFLLLMAVFRSLMVPLKAVIMNLLSIGAAYGVVIAIFQWGWAASAFGVGKGGPIEPFLPLMMFAIVFGLSMDYEVFLLSRIKEEYDRTHDNAQAVADGLAATARVITAAAAIMVFVFGSFLLESDRIIKLFGLGLSSAVLLDATVVRMLLVPATMELLGDRNWWLPKWLDRILPRIDVEGHVAVEEEEVPPRQPVGAGR